MLIGLKTRTSFRDKQVAGGKGAEVDRCERCWWNLRRHRRRCFTPAWWTGMWRMFIFHEPAEFHSKFPDRVYGDVIQSINCSSVVNLFSSAFRTKGRRTPRFYIYASQVCGAHQPIWTHDIIAPIYKPTLPRCEPKPNWIKYGSCNKDPFETFSSNT